MKEKTSIVRKFAVFIFTVIAIMGFLFILITYNGIRHYHEASTQLLNKEVAGHIAEFYSPFEGEIVDQRKADSVFYNAMVLSPGSEVYFLDVNGKVIAFHADNIPVITRQIPLAPLQTYIDTKGEKYIRGTDPRDASHKKIFSAVQVLNGGKQTGYIYVILESKKSAGIISILFGSHVVRLTITAVLIVVGLSFLFSFLYLRRISRNYRTMTGVLSRFEQGDYAARFNLNNNNELRRVTQVFNRMADLLSSSLDQLTRSDSERKHFIATISHDLRTPLAIARGYAETMMVKKDQQNLVGQEEDSYIQLIHTKLLHIEGLVRQLAELARMDSVAFKMVKEPFVLSEIVQEAVNTFLLLAVEKNISLTCSQCQYLVWIKADVSMMERVVQNLLENAIKHTGTGGTVSVVVSVEAEDVFFTISNTGAPLPQELISWINETPAGSDLLTDSSARMGLGLVIVQRILHLHKTVLKASYEDGSNIFYFRFPVYKRKNQ